MANIALIIAGGVGQNGESGGQQNRDNQNNPQAGAE